MLPTDRLTVKNHRTNIVRISTFFLARFILCGLGYSCSPSDSANSSPDGAVTENFENSGAGGGTGSRTIVEGGNQEATTGEGGNSGEGGDIEQQGEKVGSFDINLISYNSVSNNPAYTQIMGRVLEAPDPIDQMVTWEVTDRAGGCELLEPRIPFCDPECTSSQYCIKDGRCVSDPPKHDVGTVTLIGLMTEQDSNEVVLEPINNLYQPSATVDIPYPPFSEGNPIQLTTSGGDYQPFEIQSIGISPLEFLQEGEVLVEPNQPISLEWIPPGQPGISRIHVVLDISHHGGQKGELRCDVEDTGSLEIAAPLVTKLIDLGIAGFPSIQISRRAVGSTIIEPGTVELVISSYQERAVAIPGLISCDTDIPCPSGYTCQVDLSICQ